MTTKVRLICLVTALLAVWACQPLYAGDLNPPAGVVSPTHKTLTEVEPRIAINATNTPGDADSVFRIAAPGSYYLTGSVTGAAGKKGIEIAASNVSIDLGGFALLGVAGSLDGIGAPSGPGQLSIENGTISGWGGGGINLASSRNVRVSGVVISSVGTKGIVVQFNSVIIDCTVDASANTGPGIEVTCCTVISDCHVQSGGDGISVSQGCTIVNCVVNNCGDDGIVASSSGNLIARCTSNFNSGDGVQIGSDCMVMKCTASTNSQAGIHATSADNRIEGNQATDSVRGIDVDAAGNIIVRNTCSGNTTNWDVVAGNVCLVVSATAGGAILGNSGGAAPGSTDPSANFTY